MNKKILKEERSKRLKSELLRIGVFQAKRMGLSIEDFINIVFDGNLKNYIEHYMDPILNLKKQTYRTSFLYRGRRWGTETQLSRLFDGVVFEYVPLHENSNGRKIYPHINIPEIKWNFIKIFLEQQTLLTFLNDYYDLDAIKINIVASDRYYF